MCGIGGYWPKDGRKLSSRNEEIENFIDSLAHRGPDDAGIKIFREDALMLGHRRLSILDLSSQGRQPMVRNRRGKKATIVFNGEIYNYIEIKRDLTLLGYAFDSESDTEVALYAFMEWGFNAFARFNGMWALAIYDENARSLILCRDRYGVKPLYYYFDGNSFAFASELKAFQYLSDLDISVSAPNLANELAGRDLSGASSTLLNNTYQLAGGHYLVFGLEMHSPYICRWWTTLNHISSVSNLYSEQIEEFGSLFSDACQLRLRSDVPVATALSGGLDSSSVFSICAGIHSAKEHEQDVNTGFVSVFPGSDLDEAQYAKKVLGYFGGKGIYVDNNINDIVNELDHALTALELISQIPSIISVFRLYRIMKSQGFAISIDGHGGDELLGGYLHFLHNAFIDSLSPCINLSHYREVESIQKASSTSISQIGMANIEKMTHWISSTPTRLDIPGLQQDIESMRDMPTFSSSLNQSLYLAFHYSSLPAILRNFDRASMANGIESRAPLLDYRLVNFCFGLPARSKIGGSYSRRIFRDAMQGRMPEEIRTRQSKIGFGAAFDQWLQQPVFRAWLLERVNSSEFLQSHYWDGRSIADYCMKSVKNYDFKSLACVWPFLSAHFALKSIT